MKKLIKKQKKLQEQRNTSCIIMCKNGKERKKTISLTITAL